MNIIRANKMGFCFGVKKAIETCNSLSNICDKNKFVLGMIVHNKDVVNKVTNMGFKIIEEKEILNKTDFLKKGDIVIVRAHGTTSKILNILKEKEVSIYDASCVFVKKLKNILIEREALGDEIIFIGDKDHPEVIGVVSFGSKVNIFKTLDDLKKNPLNPDKSYSVLTQTTLNKKKFNEIKKYLEKHYTNLNIFDRICGATNERQEATAKLSLECDVVFIVGDLSSSNSKKLLEVAKIKNINSYLIQNETELDLSILTKNMSIGITAGASTPEETIKKIENKIRGHFND